MQFRESVDDALSDAVFYIIFFFFNDPATTEIYTLLYTLSLHDALPIWLSNTSRVSVKRNTASGRPRSSCRTRCRSEEHTSELQSHSNISYAVFCWKRKQRESGRSERKAGRGKGGRWRSERACTRLRNQGQVLLGLFFFNDPATTEIYPLLYTLSLHDALPI